MKRLAKLLSVLVCFSLLSLPLSSQEFYYIEEYQPEEESIITLMMTSEEYEEITNILNWQHNEIESLNNALKEAQKNLDVERRSSEWLRKEAIKLRTESSRNDTFVITTGILSFSVGAILGIGTGYLIWLWTGN